jgi:hypothetical protein
MFDFFRSFFYHHVIKRVQYLSLQDNQEPETINLEPVYNGT